MFIAVGLALYSLRRIRIMRAVGNLRTEDPFKVVYKRVNSFIFEPKEEAKGSPKHLVKSKSDIGHHGRG